MTPKKRSKLQSLLNIVRGENPEIIKGFEAFDNGVAELKKNLEKSIKAGTLDEVNTKLTGFQKKLDFTPLLQSFETLKAELSDRDSQYGNELQAQLESKVEEVKSLISETEGKVDDKILQILEEGASLQSQITDLGMKKIEFPPFPDFQTPIKDVETRLMEIITATQTDIQSRDKTEELRELIKKLEESVKTLRSQIANLGGGAMNRQMFINSVDPLTKYTDVNLKNGSNVTITYQANEATKKTDITISSSGGGGGSTRLIQSVSTSQTAGDTAGVDYVYLCSGTMTLTLPTAVGNTNLYTVKNVGTGIITVDTTSAQTIDGDATIIMPVQYTSVDLISDTTNWNIT